MLNLGPEESFETALLNLRTQRKDLQLTDRFRPSEFLDRGHLVLEL